MATTYQDFTVASNVGGGGTLALSVTLKALDKAHFTMTKNGANFASFAVTGSTGAWTVTCNGPLTAGDALRVTRTTPSTDAGRLVIFTDGAALDQDALNTALLQLLYIQQERDEDVERERCLVVVKATYAQTLTQNTANTWLSDANTLVLLEALGDSWQNDAGHVTVDTTADTFTLGSGTWRITIEASIGPNNAGSGEAVVAGIYSSAYELALGSADATPSGGGIAVPGDYNPAGTNPCPIGVITDVVELASSTTFEMHATMSAAVATKLGHMHVVCERLGD